jgi:cell division septum initiation protein DivIVA
MDTDTTAGTAEQGSQSAARLLELAARDADAWRAEARSEADGVLAEARAEAERVVEEARAEAGRLRAEVETARGEQQAEVERLQQLEREIHDRLRGQLTDLLSQVDAHRSSDG